MADYDYMRIGDTKFFYNLPYIVDEFPAEMKLPDDSSEECLQEVQNMTGNKTIGFTFELWRNIIGDKTYHFFYSIYNSNGICISKVDFLDDLKISNEEKLHILTDYLNAHVIDLDKNQMNSIINNIKKNIERNKDHLELIQILVDRHSK